MEKSIPRLDPSGMLPRLKAPEGPSRPSNRKGHFKSIVKVGITLGLISWILRGTSLHDIGAAVGRTHLIFILAAMAIYVLNIWIRALRWRVLLESCGPAPPVSFLVQSCLISRLFCNLLPSTIGGDAFRIYDCCSLGQSKSQSVSVIFVDRFLGLLVLVLFALVALLISNRLAVYVPHLSFWVAVAAVGMMVLVGMLFFPPAGLHEVFAKLRFPAGRKLHSLFQALFAFRNQRRTLIKALALSTVLQAVVVFYSFLIGMALDIPIDLLGFFQIAPLAAVITMLPITINGIGLRENVLVLFFAAYAVSKSEALAYALVFYLLLVFQGAMGGIVYIFRR